MSAYSIATRGLAGRKVPQGTLTPMGELLFAASEPGTWYDPSDMSTLFQDSAGTVPVTAVEQPVGLMLDKRLGLVRGVEKVANGGFDTSAGWTLGTGWSIGGGVATFDPTGQTANSDAYASLSSASDSAATYDIAVNGAFRVMLPISAGGIVEISGTVLNRTAGALRVLSAVGRIYIRALNGTGFNGSVENISVRELPGNHATQATSTKRPTYSRRVNGFTESEFRNGVTDLSTRAGLITASGLSGYLGALAVGHDGATTAIAYKSFTVQVGTPYVLSVVVEMDDGLPPKFLSVSASNAANDFALFVAAATADPRTYTVTHLGASRYSVSMSYSPTSAASVNCGFVKYSGSSNRTFKITAFDLRLATDSHLPYQWVNTATDYDADPAKFPAYLRFDGIDDAMQTGNINFTGTDKMTVWAGVTKLSDAGVGTLLGLNNIVVDGSFFLQAPYAAASPSFLYSSRGSTMRNATTSAYPSPSMAVLTGVSDISGDVVSLRVNAAVVATITTDQGTGNYGNYTLYIGGQGGTSNYFNGRIYQLIVRGAQSSLSQIEATELYVKRKMRLP